MSLAAGACRYIHIPLEYARNRYVSRKLDKLYEQNSRRIRELKDIHRGQRCFIVGTGPSLNKTDLSLLKNEVVFGVNTLYRGLPQFSIHCDYYAVSDVEVWKAHFRPILGLDTTLFLGSVAGQDYILRENLYSKVPNREVIVIREIGEMYSLGWLVKDLGAGTYLGYTVVIDICLQLAYFMGFNKVYLLGCDCDYSGLHRFDGLETETHGCGASGDWSKVFASYEICKKVYEEDGREIINTTVGGKLEIFRRARLEDII